VTTSTRQAFPPADPLVGRLAHLRTALVSDCLDQCGIRDHAMSSRLRPLYRGARLAGRAHTVHAVTVDAPPAERSDWYRGELSAFDALLPGEVIVVSTCPGGPFFGELLATAARQRGAVGAVIDAATRDSEQIEHMAFPTFVSAINALDSLGRLDVVATAVDVECGEVKVSHGDLVIADADGVVVIPAPLGARVVALAEEKSAGEDVVRDAIAAGMGAWEAFQTFGVI
jgi:regulator of RNase E activity RraA